MGHASFLKNAFWQYGLQIIKYLFPLITLPYLTRILAPEGYAVYAYVISFMAFVQVFVDFGFNLSGTKLIVHARTIDEQNAAIGAVTMARLLLCGIAGLAVLAISLCISITRENLCYTMLAYAATCGKALAPDFIFQGREKMAPLTTRYLVSKGLSTALTFALVHSAEDILWIPVLDIISNVVALVWSFVAARRMFGVSIALVPLGAALRELRTSAMYCVSNMASTAFTGFTTLLVGVVIEDAVQISYWSLAMTAVNAVQSLYTPITNSLYPHMVVKWDYRFAKKIALISLPLIAFATVLFCATSDWIVLAIGGEEYLGGAYVMRLVSPVLFLSFYGMLFGWPVLGSMGCVGELTRTTVISGLFSIITLLTISAFGFAGIAAFALVRCATEALLCALRLFECRRAIRIRK